MSATIAVMKELFANKERLIRLARYENKAKNGGTVLGTIWDILNPILQIFVYWFVFSVALKYNSRDGYPYHVWMMCGMIPWFFINSSMMSSTSSIFSFSSTLKNIAIPLSLVPAKTILSNFLDQLWTLLVLVVVLLVSKVPITWYWLELPYYCFAAFSFLLAFGLIASAVNAIFKDFQRFLNPIIRLLFYFSSVVWSLDSLPENIRFIAKFNPLAYIIDGYRNCLLYSTGIIATWQSTLIFWAITILTMILGCRLHMKLRNRFIDLI